VQDDHSAGLAPADKVHHEDIEIGKPITFGRKTVTRDEIIAFGRAFDPQPMHTDEEAAKATPVGGLIASGWHTCAMMMRMVCDGPLRHTASLGSPGVDEVRWVKPVRPGDVVSCRHVYTEKRDLASRPDVGISKLTIELVNATGDVLAWWHTNQLTRRRHPAPARPAVDGSRPARQPIASLWDAPAPPPEPGRGGFFEDRRIGETTDFGRHTFGRDEIVAFAREFDPQPFHVDEAAARASLFGALCASGWHTGAIFIHELVTHRLKRTRPPQPSERQAMYGPSPGFRNLRWPKPVYVGDAIEFRARLAEKIDLKSRPNRGILVSAGPQPEGRDRLCRPLPDPGRPPRALSAVIGD
jgi:acyl dehydratase